jgi:hypothetical protein
MISKYYCPSLSSTGHLSAAEEDGYATHAFAPRLADDIGDADE